jgi:hypothetical protein
LRCIQIIDKHCRVADPVGRLRVCEEEGGTKAVISGCDGVMAMKGVVVEKEADL